MIQAMKDSRSLRKLGNSIKDAVDGGDSGSCVLRSASWIAAGITAVTLGIVIGREIHQRYKFNRRSPYDRYSHAGDQTQDLEFGIGT
ncbi:MAG: hypothetical protein ACP5E5_05580 [Acidobacteriaceae bacterium]